MKTIKKLGLEKEFNKFLKDVKNKKNFPVGSRIKIVKLPNLATVYRLGDEGEIVSHIGRRISADTIEEFKGLPIVSFDFGGRYFIKKDYMERI